MTPIDRFERHLPAALTELADPRTPDYLIDILGQTARTRQRPAWASLERWLPMDLASTTRPIRGAPLRQLGVLALIALILTGVVAAYIGSRDAPVILPAPFGRAANGLIPYAIEGDLYTGDAVTGESASLLAGPTFDLEPVYSRDGTRIAFQRRVEPAVEDVALLMVMNADGSGVRPITSEPLRLLRWWDWSPNGDALVVVHEPRGLRTFQLFDAVGTQPPRTLAQGFQPEVPVFRPPDSAEILFRGESADGTRLYVMNTDGTDIRPITEPVTGNTAQYELREPRYSPDGSLIAYSRWDAEDGVMRFYVMNADGTGPRELGARPDIHSVTVPVWSNDGTRIAVQIARDPGNEQLFAVIDVQANTLVETGPVIASGNGGVIDWAPDDSVLLMVRNDAGARPLFLDPAGGPWTEAPWISDSFPNWQRLAD